jgi:hypothetical protein
MFLRAQLEIWPFQTSSVGQSGDASFELVQSTHPAGFGQQGKDIIDEPCRGSSTLITSAFFTNFCAYEPGIIGATGKALPSMYPSHSQELPRLMLAGRQH